MKTAGYLSLIALMGSLPDIVRIDRPVRNGDWLLHGVGDGMLHYYFHKLRFSWWKLFSSHMTSYCFE